MEAGADQSMALASTSKVVLGCLTFLVFWVMAFFPKLPFLPIGRTAGSLLGAVLMVVSQLLSPNDAFKAVDLPILGLFFGTMVLGVYFEAIGFTDAGPSLDQVSYSLVFFSGTFIAVEGFNKTGVPGLSWGWVKNYVATDSVGGIAVLSVVVAALSNIVSNVPNSSIAWYACCSNSKRLRCYESMADIGLGQHRCRKLDNVWVCS